ncbi:hypothetical protein ACFOZ7_10005 [Natribaculum luteum]|uniref:Solute carrier family 5, member 4-like protein n=1 Tax=Natribaculum luteum TaxID=1586232 RepID=A0ABD5NZ11_9EURY|nr:hypothetical protein [Natribaculum luteum]
MDLSPEEYGAYWRGAIRIAAGVLVVFVGSRFVDPLLSHSAFGATVLGVVLFVGFVLAGTFVAVLGVARVVRTAVAVET